MSNIEQRWMMIAIAILIICAVAISTLSDSDAEYDDKDAWSAPGKYT